jgi:hypothetical protein
MRRSAETTAAFVGFVALAIAVTYPVIQSATHALAGGLGDPLLGSVLLGWDADRLRHAFHGLWDAPYLFPHHYALAYTEHLLGIAVFTAPIQWLGRNPILTYNAAYIGSYALAGFGMFLLTRDLWGRTDAALLAGLAFAVTPYRVAQTMHLQVLINGWMPVALWALHRYFASGARRWLAVFAAAYAVLGLSNGYYLYFFLVPIAVAVGVELLWPRLPRLRLLTDLAVAAAAVAIVISPVAWVYYSLQRGRGFVRSYDDLPGLSAQLLDYFRVGYGAWTWGGLLQSGGGERELFQGFVASTFALVGACTIGRRGANVAISGKWSRAVGTYLVITALAIWLSMGPGVGRPYSLLYYIVPGFSGLRVPARFAAVTIVGLAVLAGAGFTWVFERMSRRAAAALAITLAAVMIVEGQHSGGTLSEVGSPDHKTWERAAYDWLRDSPPGGVLELDITRMNDFHPFTTTYQLNTLRHRHPIVNGYAGWPSELQEFLGDGVSPVHEPGHMHDVLRGLRAIGVRYVLLHESTFAGRGDPSRIVAEIQANSEQIAEVQRFGDIWAWRLIADRPHARAVSSAGTLERIDPHSIQLRASTAEERLPFVFDGDVETRWMTSESQTGHEWIELRFPHATNVARLRLETAPRGLLDYPRTLAIESIDSAGHATRLFDGTVVTELIEALAADEQRAPIDFEFPANDTVALRLRQTGRSQSWWSVFEMKLWHR